MFTIIFVPTIVHIPPRLLASVDRRARALGISRSRLIIQTLERDVEEAAVWSDEFLKSVRNVDPEIAKAAAELPDDVIRRRKSKPAPEL